LFAHATRSSAPAVRALTGATHRTGCDKALARVALWVLVAVATVAPQGVKGAAIEDQSLAEKLKRLDEQSKKIEDLTADFVEEKHTFLLKEPLVSKGRVRVLGARTRWDTTEPHVSTLYTDAKQVALYFPSRKTAEVYPIDRRLRPLIVSPIPRLDTLQRHFRIEQQSDDQASNDLLLLKLTPKDPALTEFLDEVRVWIDLSVGLAKKVEMIDPDGDRTIIAFSDIRTNTGLTDEDVTWNFSPGTRVVHPLEGEPGSESGDGKPDQP